MKKSIVALAALSALGLTTVGFAQGGSGLYLNANIGFGKMDSSDHSVSLPGFDLSSKNEPLTWSAVAGYQFNEYLAIELGYLRIPGLKVDAKFNGADLGGYKVESSGFLFDAKLIYPIDQEFSVYGKLGGVALSTKQDDTTVANASDGRVSDGTVFLLGAGLSYQFDQNWSASAEFLYTFEKTLVIPETYSGLVGLTYKFAL